MLELKIETKTKPNAERVPVYDSARRDISVIPSDQRAQALVTTFGFLVCEMRKIGTGNGTTTDQGSCR
jgi:hypothetical protein